MDPAPATHACEQHSRRAAALVQGSSAGKLHHYRQRRPVHAVLRDRGILLAGRQTHGRFARADRSGGKREDGRRSRGLSQGSDGRGGTFHCLESRSVGARWNLSVVHSFRLLCSRVRVRRMELAAAGQRCARRRFLLGRDPHGHRHVDKLRRNSIAARPARAGIPGCPGRPALPGESEGLPSGRQTSTRKSTGLPMPAGIISAARSVWRTSTWTRTIRRIFSVRSSISMRPISFRTRATSSTSTRHTDRRTRSTKNPPSWSGSAICW